VPIGDPLEQQTFEAAGGSLQDTGELRGVQQLVRVQLSTDEPELCMVIREQFEFSSTLQRMPVLAVDTASGETWAFVKGSPEVMETLCTPSSVPKDYKGVLATFAHAGYRIIAIGRKRMGSIPALEKPELRVAVERDLEFLGLILLENKLKEETEPTLAVLRAAGMGCCMISGDNALTCVTVAKDCKLVEPGGAHLPVGGWA
jgi:cation-transporting ATPase 13A2